MVIVVDDEDRENEGDLTIAAEKVTPEAINFMARYGRGLICLSMTPERLDELEIPLMVSQNTSRFETAFCVPIDAKGRTTHRHLGRRSRRDGAGGDRSGDAAVGSGAARPHVPAARARRAACMVRAGQTEAAVDLARIAGLYPAGVICEIMNEDGTMARVPQLTKFAKQHGLLMITVADLIKYRMRTESLVKRVASAKLPTELRRVSRARVRKPGGSTGRTSRWSAATSANGKDVLVRVHSSVPDRRRAALDPLRLRRAARRRDAADRRRRARRAAVSAIRKAAASAWPTRSAPTSCRTRASTRSRPTSGSASRRISATTAWACRSCASSASARCAC